MEKINTLLRFYILPIILWPLFLWLFILLIPLMVLVYIIRTTEYVIYRTLYAAELLPYDDVVWTMDVPQNDLNINCCLILDGVLEIETFREVIDKCLIKAEDGKGNLLYWKATKRIHPGCVNYYWMDDETFDIEDHVYQLFQQTVCSKQELKNVISDHRSTELELKTHASPWEFVLIPYEEGDHKKTVIFCRLSHAIADGSALAYFLINGLGQYQYHCKEKTVLKYSQKSKGIAGVDQFIITVKGFWRLPVVQLGFLLSRPDKNILHVNRASGSKTLTWSNPVNLASVKYIKNKLGTTVNDVLLGCLASSLNEYFLENGSVSSSDVSVVFPFDIRSSPEEAKGFGNKVAVIILRLPSVSDDLIVSIRKAKHRMDDLKTSGEPIGSRLCWKLVSFLLPKFMTKTFVFTTIDKTTGSLSNLAGPQNTLTIGGCPLDMMMFWPPQTHNHSFGVAFCSYDGHIMMGVESDNCLSVDTERICRTFEENVKKLIQMTVSQFV